MALDLDIFRRYVRLRREIDDLKKQRDAKVIEVENLVDPLLAKLVEEGMKNVNMNVDGLGTVTLYPHTQLRASIKDTRMDEKGKLVKNHAPLVAALRANDLGDIAKTSVNANTLSALVRESREEGGTPLPKEVMDLIEINESDELHMRAS